MRELLNNDNIERNTNECSPLYSSFIYCILINRISRGYSAEELSFLLGQEDNFIENLELLKDIDFSVDLYWHLYRVFGHAHFIHHQYHEEKTMMHEMATWRVNDTIFYRMEYFINTHESVLLFQLSEESPVYRERYTNSIDMEIERCQKGLCLMIEQGAFDKPISALAIYRQIEDIIETKVDPINLKKELDKLWGRKGKAPLKRTKRRSYTYRYVLHPGAGIGEALYFVKQKFDKLSWK